MIGRQRSSARPIGPVSISGCGISRTTFVVFRHRRSRCWCGRSKPSFLAFARSRASIHRTVVSPASQTRWITPVVPMTPSNHAPKLRSHGDVSSERDHEIAGKSKDSVRGCQSCVHIDGRETVSISETLRVQESQTQFGSSEFDSLWDSLEDGEVVSRGFL